MLEHWQQHGQQRPSGRAAQGVRPSGGGPPRPQRGAGRQGGAAAAASVALAGAAESFDPGALLDGFLAARAGSSPGARAGRQGGGVAGGGGHAGVRPGVGGSSRKRPAGADVRAQQWVQPMRPSAGMPPAPPTKRQRAPGAVGAFVPASAAVPWARSPGLDMHAATYDEHDLMATDIWGRAQQSSRPMGGGLPVGSSAGGGRRHVGSHAGLPGSASRSAGLRGAAAAAAAPQGWAHGGAPAGGGDDDDDAGLELEGLLASVVGDQRRSSRRGPGSGSHTASAARGASRPAAWGEPPPSSSSSLLHAPAFMAHRQHTKQLGFAKPAGGGRAGSRQAKLVWTPLKR